MYSRLRSNLYRTAIALTLLGSVAHAQLLLSGRVTGMFTDTPGAHDSIYNAPDGSFASFKSGVPDQPGGDQTMIEFAAQTFTDIGPGPVATDLFKLTNGRNFLGTTASSAHFDLWLELTSPVTSSTLLTPVGFTIMNTPNGDGNVDDVYSFSSSPISPMMIDNYRVQFMFSAPDGFTLHEKDSGYMGDLSVRFTPVPEPSTYALTGAALLMGLVGFRSLRRRTFQTALVSAG